MDFRLSMLGWAEQLSTKSKTFLFWREIVCQWIEPIPQIFDSSSMLSYSIDIQLAKILRPWNTVGFEIFQLPKVWFFSEPARWAKKSRQVQICQIARMLKFIYEVAEGIMFLTSPRVHQLCFCERFSSKTIERNFLKHGSF
jgi:hypothetical protein